MGHKIPNKTFQTISLCSDERLVLKISAFESLIGDLTQGTRGNFSRTWWDASELTRGQRHMLTWVTVKTWLKPKTALEKSLTLRVLEPALQPPDHLECKDLVVADARWSLTAVDPQVVYFEKRSRLIYFLEDNLLDVFLG